MAVASKAELFRTARALQDAGVVHGFSVRAAGDLRAPEELARLAAAAGVSGVATARQVHEDRVLGAAQGGGQRELLASSAPAAAAAAAASSSGADALVALDPGVAVGVFTADCVPVLLYAPDTGAAAAVHSGWRGSRLRIAARGVRALEGLGARAGRMIAAVGPCIGACCYEVSPELADGFRALFGDDVARGRHLDLRRVVERTLREAGVARVEQVEGCTSCDTASFFSFRRDPRNSGRQLSFIASGPRPHSVPLAP